MEAKEYLVINPVSSSEFIKYIFEIVNKGAITISYQKLTGDSEEIHEVEIALNRYQQIKNRVLVGGYNKDSDGSEWLNIITDTDRDKPARIIFGDLDENYFLQEQS